MLKRFEFFVVLLTVLLVMPSFAMSVDEGQAGRGEEIYSLSADATLYELAVDSGVSPLFDLPSYTQWTVSLHETAGGNLVSLYSFSVKDDPNLSSGLNALSRSYSNDLYQLFNTDVNQQSQINALADGQNSIADVIKQQLGFPDGNSLYDGGYLRLDNDLNWVKTTFPKVFSDFLGTQYSYFSDGFYVLNSDGTNRLITKTHTSQLLERGFMGLGSLLRGDSGSVISGQLLKYDDLTQSEFSANNLLSMLSPLLNIQNDLARVAHVIADPEDQAINDANQDNKKQLVDSFGSDGAGVKPSDIGDMAGVSDGLTGNFDTGVSVGDMFGQINDSSRWSFFSEETASNLDTVPVTFSDDDDFIEFYDPENKALFELLGRDLP